MLRRRSDLAVKHLYLVTCKVCLRLLKIGDAVTVKKYDGGPCGTCGSTCRMPVRRLSGENSDDLICAFCGRRFEPQVFQFPDVSIL
jgi:hypothetical protein